MKNSTIVILAAIGVGILWTANWIGVKWYYGCDTAGLGTFGDMFGATNALFSGLTIIGLIYTIVLQRDEIKNTKKVSEDQLRLARYQRFDGLFFNYLELHRRIYEDLKPPFYEFEERYIKPVINQDQTLTEAISSYQSSMEDQHVVKNFNNYLNTFNIVVEFIISSKRETQEKYLSIYFSQFHIGEKKMLWYQFNAGKVKPPHWDIIKTLVFAGLKKSHIEYPIFRKSEFIGLEN